MNTPGLISSKRAGAAIGGLRLVIHGSADGLVIQASASTSALIGVSGSLGAESGKPVDVVRSGIAPVEYGGTVSRGAPLTSDSNGRAVAVTLPPTASTYIIGFAEVAGASGDIGSVQIAPGVITPVSA